MMLWTITKNYYDNGNGKDNDDDNDNNITWTRNLMFYVDNLLYKRQIHNENT